MRKIIPFLLIACLFFVPHARAAPKWDESAQRIEQTITESLAIYEAGDVQGAKDKVNDAYYGIYEKDGLESAVSMGVSGKMSNLTEYQFYKLKKAMMNGENSETVKAEADRLIEMVYENTAALENASVGQGGWASFVPAFLILLREGLEAILVLVAIIAYLRRSGSDGKYLDTVYNAMIAAIIASFVTAYLFNSVFESAAAGAGRELLEGATALFATVVLLLTSAWLGGKADAKVWKEYIKGMVDKSMTTGKARALAFAAFLAVYREGAEVILFYQALFNGASADVEMIWGGFLAGCAALAAIFFLLQHGVLKIPLRPFFIFTSAMMYLLAVSFAGGGVRELQEGGVIANTQIENLPVPTIDVLGIYPTAETLGIQIFLLLMAVLMLVWRRSRNNTQTA